MYQFMGSPPQEPAARQRAAAAARTAVGAAGSGGPVWAEGMPGEIGAGCAEEGEGRAQQEGR